jgi:hypothetical protein
MRPNAVAHASGSDSFVLSSTGHPNEVLARWEVGKSAEGVWLDGQAVVGVFGGTNTSCKKLRRGPTR